MFAQFFLHRTTGCTAWLGLLVFVFHNLFRAYIKYMLNLWYEEFYDLVQTATALQTFESSGSEFGSKIIDDVQGQADVRRLIMKFATIVAPMVVVHPIATWIRNQWVLRWRLTLINDYAARWDASSAPVEGASQRVHEDTQRFADGVHTCVSSGLEALLTLLIFCPVLYKIDTQLTFISVFAAVGGLAISMCVGRKLVGLEVANQVVEAELRKQLVCQEIPAMSERVGAGLRSDEFRGVMGSVRVNYLRLYNNFALLQFWLTGFDEFMAILPYAVMGPRLFAAEGQHLTLGGLVRAANAFGKVFAALNVVNEMWMSINEFRSVIRRLKEFELALPRMMPTGMASQDKRP
jgi:peptide/bleomycin uptake transporter